MTNPINPDEYTLVRNIPVRNELIEEYRQKNGKLVTDPVQLKQLDAALAEFRRIHERNPVYIATDQSYYFFEELIVPTGLFLDGFAINQTNHELDLKPGEAAVKSPTPIWFVTPKKFTIGGIKQ